MSETKQRYVLQTLLIFHQLLHSKQLYKSVVTLDHKVQMVNIPCMPDRLSDSYGLD